MPDRLGAGRGPASGILPRLAGLVPHPKHRSIRRALRWARLGDRRTADRGAWFNLAYHVRLLGLRHRWLRERLVAGVAIDPADAAMIRDALRAGRGAVVASVHLGDFDVAAVALARAAGVPLSAVVEGRTAGWNLYHAARRRAGLTLRFESPDRAAALLDDLGANRLVAIMLDRRGPEPMPARLCGRPAILTGAPIYLSRAAGAPLFAITCAAVDGHRRVRVWPVERPGSPARPAGAVMRQVAEIVSAEIARAPEQWLIPADLRQLPWTELPASRPAPGRRADDIPEPLPT